MKSFKASVRYLALLAVTSLLVVACSGSGSTGDTAVSDPGDAATAGADDAEPNSAADGPADDEVPDAAMVTEDDLARFVASTEAVMADTSLAGVVFDDPEIYIAIAQASCARFTEGASLKEVVAEHLSDTPGLSEDEQIIGAILGAAVETICPEHTGRL